MLIFIIALTSSCAAFLAFFAALLGITAIHKVVQLEQKVTVATKEMKSAH